MVNQRKRSHPLRAYLTANHIAQADFARKLRISKAEVSMIISGQRRPRPDLAFRIAAETGIPFEAFFVRSAA
jgi:transcriptional regulator with XRE-family HTH domain